MKQEMSWYDHITINLCWLGLNVASGVITPVLLPYLVVLFVPPEFKNTYLANVRVVGLAAAMMVQPMAGMVSDRSTLRWGRRRPYILGGTMLDLLFLLLVASSTLFVGSEFDGFFQDTFSINTAYAVLIAGVVLLQVSSNVAQGALQGLIPDLVPEDQRGRSSGFKAVMELLPVFVVLFIGPLVDAGRVWLTVGIASAALLVTMSITVAFAHEEPLREKPTGGIGERVLRLAALTIIFVAVTRAAVWMVQASGTVSGRLDTAVGLQAAVVGLAGLLGMAGSIFVGVYLSAWIGIGREAHQQTSFIWWVINRLLFLAAVGSIQGFALYYLSDVHHIPDPAAMTTKLLAVVGLFLLPSALLGGYLADRVGRKRLVAYSGLIAGGGTLLLLFAGSVPLVLISGCIVGIGTGTFMATNWALGTDLAPPQEAGRYLGISNLAGAGAGIVGAGIGGPMADSLNALRPGLGYVVIFAVYGALFFLSTATLTLVRVRPAAQSAW